MQPQSLSRLLPFAVLAALLAATVALPPSLAQPAKSKAAQSQPAKAEQEDFQPQSGQEGKDVVWVPTPQALVDTMLDMARVTPNDYVIDLGSGDGRTVITAAKRGAKARGVEYNPKMVALSQRNALKEGVSDRATFVQGDIFETDFSQADVVTLFLLPSLNVRLRPTILQMRPGTRVVSNTFDMGDWQADETGTAAECSNYCTALLWIVPANVNGTWKSGDGELSIMQQYQNLSGTVRNGGVTAQLIGKMIGDRIEMIAGRAHYSGRVSGNRIEGTVRSDAGEAKWEATRP